MDPESLAFWQATTRAKRAIFPQNRAQSSFWIVARPAKAGMFSGSQSHQGKSQSPVTWVASVEETKRMKPTDKAIFRMVSESPGRNASEPSGGLDKK
jgi:hypothetical protein